MPTTSPSSSGWEPPSPEDLQRLLPQYEITSILGRGGMGAVYRGRQAKLDRPVAIKILPETFTQGPDELNFAARFLQEARAMARLDHPAIISVYDFGETDQGQLYFVMEFVDGMDIHQYLHHHGGKLPQEQALAIVAHVLDALDYAHSHGIVHRDIKPANILLNHEGRVKIADFGLAKRFGEGSGDSAPALTMTNVAVGTPDFVAPEALEAGRTVDHRADLYAVGVMLYQLLTGKLPRGSFQPPSVLVPEIDPRIDDIVTKATASDPDYRYASASAVRADLDRIFSQPMTRIEPGDDSAAVPVAVPVTDSVKQGGKAAPAKGRLTTRPQPASPPPPPRGPLFAGIGLAAALVIGGGAFFLFRGDDTPPPAPATTPEPAPPPVVAEKKATTPTPPAAQPKASPAPATPTAPAPKAAATPTPQPVAETAPVPGQWTKIYETLDSLPEGLRDPKGKRSVQLVEGWITPRALGSTIPLPVSGSDYGVRARFKAIEGDDSMVHGIVLRAQSGEIGRQVYQMRRSGSVIHVQRRESDQDVTIKQMPTAPLAKNGEFSLEFIVMGKKLICRSDGGEPYIGEDNTYLRGGAFIYIGNMAVRDIEIIRLDGVPEAEALRLAGVTDAAPTPPATTTTAAEPPAPMPAASPTSAGSVPAPAPAPAAATLPASLATLPGLRTRLDGFHTARRAQLGDLAKKYLAGLDARLNQAADAGDLRLATAFEAEKQQVQTLQGALAQPPADPVAAVTDTGASALPDLPAGSPEPLVALRQTWTTESAKIRTSLDAALQQSLQALEAELTRARDFESAKAVLTWREALADGSAGTPARPAAAAPAAPMATAPTDDAAGKSARAPSAPDLAAATKEKPFENSLGMKFVPVPGTDVLFCIHETRWRDYEKFAKKNRGIAIDWEKQDHDEFKLKDNPKDHPVVAVSWNDANAFCKWLTEYEGKVYRLPTDQEWSFAVGRAHLERSSADPTPANFNLNLAKDYPWGSEWPPPAKWGNYSDASRRAKAPNKDAYYLEGGYDDGFPTTAPVMSFSANEFGLYDLSGNASEWCEDWFSEAQQERVLRGGDWNTGRAEILFRTLYRIPAPPAVQRSHIGFRIVLETSASPAAPAAPASPAASAASDTSKNPFGWQPIPENPFPLPRPTRPTTPCRVVAWRLDGQPVDEAAFRQLFGGVPADLGEVVDLDSENLFSPDSVVTSQIHPIALKGDGSFVMMREFDHPTVRDAVKVEAGGNIGIALHADGTVTPFLINAKEVVDLTPMASWKDCVAISAGMSHAIGLTSKGIPMTAGNNSHQQCDIPEEGRTAILDVVAVGHVSNVLRFQGDRVDVFRFGLNTNGVLEGKPNERTFMNYIHYCADTRGRLYRDNISETYSADLENFRGNQARDIRDVSDVASYNPDPRQSPDRFGIVAAREGEDQWHFWGDRGPLGEYDSRHCETKAAGCWKLFFIGDYVLALKPVANLKPDDWTGAATTAAPAAAAPKSGTPDARLAAATKEKPFENSLGMKFVPVPGTDVLFCIHETRYKDFAEFATDQRGLSDEWKQQTHHGFVIRKDSEDHPVCMVDWMESSAFCEWLSKKEKRTYRLPTDREWSIAAGIGHLEVWNTSSTPETVDKPLGIYPWGKDWPPVEGAGNYSDESRRKKIETSPPGVTYIDGYEDGFPTTAPVMSFQANSFGLFDISGNVWEWVGDWYSGEERERTIRGGSWNDAIDGSLTLTARKTNQPGDRFHARGFRIVLETGGSPAAPVP